VGRLLTVIGLTGVVLGLGSTAVVLLVVPPASAGLAIAVPMLLAGVSGGFVVSPNVTMALRCVPVRMAGSAGGALQTGQRIGAAVGAATLAGLFYMVLATTGGDFPPAVAVALGGAVLAMGFALVIGVVDWCRGRRRPEAPDRDESQPHVADTHAHH
ncbi:MAG: MFS transporter, partial [Pseudonocardia sp.]